MNNLVEHGVDTSFESTIILGMICSQEYMENIIHAMESRFFLSPHIKQISYWVLEYYQEFGKVPEKTIQEIFAVETRHSTIQDADLIDILLRKIFQDNSGKDFNVKYILLKTLEWIRERSLFLLLEE